MKLPGNISILKKFNYLSRYDQITKQWSFVAPMSTPRSTVGVAVLDGKLYAVGGRDGSSCLNSVECYDPNTNRWTLVSPMLKRRGGKSCSNISYGLGFLSF